MMKIVAQLSRSQLEGTLTSHTQTNQDKRNNETFITTKIIEGK